MDKQTDSAIRFSLLSALAVTSYIAFTLVVVSYTNSVAWGIHLSLLLFGWVMWRCVRGHLAGLVLAILGCDVLLCSSVAWTVYGSEDVLGLRGLVNAFGTVLVVVGFGVLLLVGAKEHCFWNRQAGIAASILCTLVAYWIAVPTLGNAAIARRRASDIAVNNLATAKAIALVERVRRQTGAAPEKEALLRLLDEPLPPIRWSGHSCQIEYVRTTDSTYRLSYLEPFGFFGDIIVYDSATPQKGWYRIPF